jgi:hypothetical protein
MIAVTLIVGAAAATLAADEPDQPQPDPPEVRYRMPTIVMTAHADWPKDPKYHDEMAEYVVNNGFNVVEGGIEVLDVCRKHGLMVQLGGDQATLNVAQKLKDDPAVFGYFMSDRKRSSSFPLFAQQAAVFELFQRQAARPAEFAE